MTAGQDRWEAEKGPHSQGEEKARLAGAEARLERSGGTGRARPRRTRHWHGCFSEVVRNRARKLGSRQPVGHGEQKELIQEAAAETAKRGRRGGRERERDGEGGRVRERQGGRKKEGKRDRGGRGREGKEGRGRRKGKEGRWG